MSKLLPTRLPISDSVQVSSDIYNRLVRILEINLGEFDPSTTLLVNNTERDEGFFNQGTIIFNTNTDTLQCWDGTRWRDLFGSQFYINNDLGFGLTGSLGSVSVSTP
jgi:hypothetical protein